MYIRYNNFKRKSNTKKELKQVVTDQMQINIVLNEDVNIISFEKLNKNGRVIDVDCVKYRNLDQAIDIVNRVLNPIKKGK